MAFHLADLRQKIFKVHNTHILALTLFNGNHIKLFIK